ncbi:hypothetical protein Zm00014a_020530 [Zea mays]|uniref:Uncharacterized protein n=1 Tax=Zea mays TaxID=4577 RepID=A0A3L6EY79_MAIZE|nr:hypothetical protein Zm00014a_020530 [Zea mays]
MGGLGLLYG